jgi:hypothetical protein
VTREQYEFKGVIKAREGGKMRAVISPSIPIGVSGCKF